ncbi:MAG: twin-arginine translocation signal domain-containing protein, partial [Planctomycetaceae bacterium]
MPHHTTRREFLKAALAAGTALPAASSFLHAADQPRGPRSANEKLNLGIIGVSGRGGNNLEAVAGENIVILCDIDAQHLEQTAAKFPDAATTDDFRAVLDRDDLDDTSTTNK